MPQVLATACRVALVEATCFDALKPFPKEGRKTVGAHVDLSNVAATAMGMRVTAQVDLVAAEGRKLRFKVGAGGRRRLSGPWRGWRRRR